jgi:FkbM family methyltransferase
VFEASSQYYKNIKTLFESNQKVTIVHKALSETHGDNVKLYHAPNTVGHSVFKTKDNIIEDDYEQVESIIFSEWIKENDIVLDGCLNILKVNIEGAEWYLFNDLVDTGLIDNFSIFLGSGHDIEKVGELKERAQEYYDILESHNIEILRFSEWKPERNVDVVSLIDAKLSEME